MPTARSSLSAATKYGAAALLGYLGGAVGVTLYSGLSRRSYDGFEHLDVPLMPPAEVIRIPERGEIFIRHHRHPDPNAPTFVLLHGWLLTADLNWHSSFDELSAHGHIIAPDHRGHGRGIRTATPFRLSDVADDIIALCEQLNTGPVILVGFSMGGVISQMIWRSRPDLVDGIVLCSTASHFQYGPFGQTRWYMMFLFQVAARLFPRRILDAFTLWRMTGKWRHDLGDVSDSAVHPGHRTAWIVGEIDRGDREDFADVGRELGRFDSRRWLSTIDVPTAVVLTTRDRIAFTSAQRELVELLGDPFTVEVDGNHDAPTNQPEAFSAAVTAAAKYVVKSAYPVSGS